MTGVLKQKMMPAIFFGHGSPMNALENNKYTRSWVNVVRDIPKPKAILVISAHWQTNGVHVTSNKRLKTIHDFYGFPKELHDVRYDVNGSEELVGKIQNLIHEVKPDESWGADHGAWSILKHIYPNADIPVVQLSVDSNKTPSQHFHIAKKLQTLRDDGVLIIGSGNIVHNLRMMEWGGVHYEWAAVFNNAIKDAIITHNFDAVVNYNELTGAKESVPTQEHFIPLIYILGLYTGCDTVGIFADGIEFGSISMTSLFIQEKL